MSRAERRHQRERIKVRRRFFWGRDLRADPKAASMVVDTPKPCSCLLCGNRRKYIGPTLQELRCVQVPDC